MNIKNTRLKRQTRIRKNVVAHSDRVRLCVFRSNKYIYAQIIDQKGDTLMGISEKVLAAKGKATPTERAKELGVAIAKLAISKKVKEVAFDKGRFSYHGRVEAVATGAREGGLKF
ncbi:MAG TPA: 50S ribosomal protein L18 [Xanthomonadales bacterium]|nr:50S ribosomal protein L18 [Xanthomonadales bacterium]